MSFGLWHHAQSIVMDMILVKNKNKKEELFIDGLPQMLYLEGSVLK